MGSFIHGIFPPLLFLAISPAFSVAKYFKKSILGVPGNPDFREFPVGFFSKIPKIGKIQPKKFLKFGPNRDDHT